MFQNKEVKIKLSQEAESVYEELNHIVEKEKQKGIESSLHQTLLRSINRVKEILRQDPFKGDQVPKRQIPAKYIIKYNVNNLWRIELSDRWRLVYTIKGNQLEIINFVVDIFDHRDYDNVFGYKH